jgi:hypothetical protein
MRLSLALVVALLLAGGSVQAAEPTMCTMQYDPVCAVKDGVESTYGDSCTAGAANAQVLYKGECRPQEAYVPPKNCTAWFDGCNHCSRTESGEAMCTMMACMGAPQPGYCTAYTDGTPPEMAPEPEKPTMEEALAATGTSPAEVTVGSFFTRLWTYLVTRLAGIF